MHLKLTRLHIVPFVISLFVITPIYAELTLSQALSEALDNAPAIQRSKAAVTEAEWNKNQVYSAGFIPKLSAGASHFFEHKYQILDIPLGGVQSSFPTIYPTTIYGLKGVIPIFDGFASTARFQAAKWSQKSAEKALSHTEFQLQQAVRLAYYQALAAKKKEEVAQIRVYTLDAHVAESESLNKKGRITNYAHLQAQFRLNEAKLDAADAQDEFISRRQKLSQLLAHFQDNRLLAGELPIPDIQSVSTLTFSDSLESRADLLALTFNYNALSESQASLTPWYTPQVSVMGAYNLYNNQTEAFTGEAFRTDYQLGVILNWDLFDGGVSQANFNRVKAQKDQLESTLQDAKLGARIEFEEYKRQYLSSATRFFLQNKAVQLAQERGRLARLQAKAGVITPVEVLDTELDLLRAKLGRVEAQLNAIQAQIKLENTIGRTL